MPEHTLCAMPDETLRNKENDAALARLDIEALTWSALLTQCVAIAQAAVALPDDSGGGSEAAAWRVSVPDVIQLQAVWFGLAKAREGALPDAERRLGRDRAAVMLEHHGDRLRRLWAPQGGLPASVASLVEDVAGLVHEAGEEPPKSPPAADFPCAGSGDP